MVGGASAVEMLERTNLVAVVGGGQAPKYPERNGMLVDLQVERTRLTECLITAVMIWDDNLKKFVYEFAFASPVIAVRMRRDK